MAASEPTPKLTKEERLEAGIKAQQKANPGMSRQRAIKNIAKWS